LNDAAVRTLLGKASGAISLSDAYGKSNQFAFTISSNQTNANLRTLAVNAGWNQSTKVVATISSGNYIRSNSTGTPALTVNGSFPGGVDLVNNGFIVGMGGKGGNGAGGGFVQAGSVGGLALSVSSAISITNNGTIAGGGGGGGGGFYYDGGKDRFGAGGGGGGGRSSAASNSAGGTAGSGSNGLPAAQNGQAGTVNAAGAGGGGGENNGGFFGGSGGNGGNWGSSGASGGSTKDGSGGGGGGGGGAVTGNSNITYIATGTRLGAIT
jgi:hypothetical protein